MGTQVEDGGGSWISGFWAAGSFRAAAESVYVQWHPWRGGLSSHMEGPHLLRGAPRRGSEYAECLPEVAPRRGGETRVRGLSPSPHQVQGTPLQSLQVSVRLSPNALVQVLNSLKRWVPGVHSFSFNPPKHIFIFSGQA